MKEETLTMALLRFHGNQSFICNVVVLNTTGNRSFIYKLFMATVVHYKIYISLVWHRFTAVASLVESLSFTLAR